jgi:DnaJ-class molecular chaperone
MWKQFETAQQDLALWHEGRDLQCFIDGKRCPHCQGTGLQDGQRCAPCRGDGAWSRGRARKMSVNAILAQKHGLSAKTVKEARGDFNKIMSKFV